MLVGVFSTLPLLIEDCWESDKSVVQGLGHWCDMEGRGFFSPSQLDLVRELTDCLITALSVVFLLQIAA